MDPMLLPCNMRLKEQAETQNKLTCNACVSVRMVDLYVDADASLCAVQQQPALRSTSSKTE